MSLLTKGGISKLSELEIDAAPVKAASIAELILTTPGDVLHRAVAAAARLGGSFGSGYNYLHCKNTGQYGVEWHDIEDLIIYLTGAVNRAIALPSLCIPVPDISLVVAEDDSGGGHPVAPDALVIPVPTISVPTLAATSVNAVGGAVAHDDDGVDTDETTEANNATANDMTLLQPDGAAADWYALGYASKHDGVVINVGTAGADITLDTLQYSKGAGAWGTLTPILNQLNNWETTGKVWFTFERPADWATDTVGGIANMYWIKIKASTTGAGYSQPKGTQAWILVYP